MSQKLHTKTIKIAHSPDSDDAFMFYAIKEAKIDLKGYKFEISSDEIDILNNEALNDEFKYDIFAVSFHAFNFLKDKFKILKSGASMGGKDYGPKLVCRTNVIQNRSETKMKDPMQLSQQHDLVHWILRFAQNDGFRIAVPGKLTSAYLVLKEWLKENNIEAEFLFCSYEEVFDLLESGKVDASLLIHEAQLRYQELGYKLITDLGIWWYQRTNGLNMPLGCNVIRRDLGAETINELEALLKESIEWGLANFDEVLDYSRKFANNKLDNAAAKKYIEMYVNDSTVELSSDDLKSIDLLLSVIASD